VAPREMSQEPALEDYLVGTWDAYCKIIKGVETVGLQDLVAYCQIYNESFDRWQVDAILGLDQERLIQWQTQSQD
tara:strand:+ start:1504 stop:1728 length:225 start_codon:yes stop_codon:yes gene_type:complete